MSGELGFSNQGSAQSVNRSDGISPGGVLKGYIHHRDGNPLNNPLDWSNYEVVCSVCHGKVHHRLRLHRKEKNAYSAYGFRVHVSFDRWLRAELIKKAKGKCEECGAHVSLDGWPSPKNQLKPLSEQQIKSLLEGAIRRCTWCRAIIKGKSPGETANWSYFIFENGKIMCRQCFDAWQKAGSPPVWSRRHRLGGY